MADRTEDQIVKQTNDLARICLRYIGTGYEVPAGFKFFDAPASNYRARKAWSMACEIQEFMTGTDPNDAVANLDGMTALDALSVA
jgi:hypothetical protein